MEPLFANSFERATVPSPPNSQIAAVRCHHLKSETCGGETGHNGDRNISQFEDRCYKSSSEANKVCNNLGMYHSKRTKEWCCDERLTLAK